MEKEALVGGRTGKIQKVGDTVIRPANIWTTNVHSFLRYCIDEGSVFVPTPYGINNDGDEMVSYMPGDVYNALPSSLLSDSLIVSAATLLRKLHELGEQYIPKLTSKEQWMLPVVSPVEVMCHGDFAPYNVTIVNGKAHGIIDFDTLHPGSRMWDIVYAVYRWVLSIDCRFYGKVDEQIQKTKLFLDSYGVKTDDRHGFVELLVKRLESLMDYMKCQAQSGNTDFQQHIDDGHLQVYLSDIEYIKKHELEISQGIM